MYMGYMLNSANNMHCTLSLNCGMNTMFYIDSGFLVKQKLIVAMDSTVC